MYMTKSLNESMYTKKNTRKLNIKKLKENAVRVNEVNGRIKLDKRNQADIDWYFG